MDDWTLLRHMTSVLGFAPMLGGMTAARLLQGPFADAMTHAGQLAMLRRRVWDEAPSGWKP